MKNVSKMLKKIFEIQGIVAVDINDYTDKNFKDKFEKLTEGRIVSTAFISNKFNSLLKKEQYKRVVK